MPVSPEAATLVLIDEAKDLFIFFAWFSRFRLRENFQRKLTEANSRRPDEPVMDGECLDVICCLCSSSQSDILNRVRRLSAGTRLVCVSGLETRNGDNISDAFILFLCVTGCCFVILYAEERSGLCVTLREKPNISLTLRWLIRCVS